MPIQYEVYDKTGTFLSERTCNNSATIWDIISDLPSSYWITALSETLWWTPLSVSTLVNNTTCLFYDVSPSAETITGFYLDWTEYKFKWWWAAEWISTDQPSSPVAGSIYYDTTNKVIKVYNWTAWEEVGWGNVIAMTQAEYNALSSSEKADGKLRIISDAPTIEVGNVSSTSISSLVVSNSSPASWTPNSVITFVI